MKAVLNLKTKGECFHILATRLKVDSSISGSLSQKMVALLQRTEKIVESLRAVNNKYFQEPLLRGLRKHLLEEIENLYPPHVKKSLRICMSAIIKTEIKRINNKPPRY